MCQIVQFKKGEMLFREGEECSSIGIVIKGCIKISSYTFNGHEVIYNSLNEGMVFGNNLLFSSDPIYRGNVICERNGRVVFIDRKSLLSIVKSNDLFLTEYLKIQSEFTKKLNNQLKMLSFDKAEDRLLYYLLSHQNYVRFFTVSSLANELYLQRETLSRLINKLINDKKIVRDKHTIKLL